MGFIFPLVLVAAVYFLMLRPQQQRVARQRSLIASIEPGDEIVTAGGMLGHVQRIDDERVWVEVAPGVEITLLRGAIAQRVLPPPGDEDPEDDLTVDGDERGDEGFNGL
ncbi:MAG TPA: preprotein translocase subunit YajC [Acidimicrobiales bacterium]|nr:preprotein translocase subunit YajC [Acidimicrobiales bacterium]